MSNLQSVLAKRRSIYQLGKKVNLSTDAITQLVKNTVREAPTSFNSQSSRAVILFGNEHNKLWDLTETELRKVVPADQFSGTKAKIDSFKAAFGTALFFESQHVVKTLQEQFALYANNFPIWSQQSTGIAQYAVWLALAEQNIGASIQHYNPLIDSAVQKTWGISEDWKLLGQMPFGSIEAPADPKSYIDDSERFKVFNS